MICYDISPSLTKQVSRACAWESSNFAALSSLLLYLLLYAVLPIPLLKPLHRPHYSLLHAPPRHIPEQLPRFIHAVEPRHATELHLLPVQVRRPAREPEQPFNHRSQRQSQPLVNRPDLLRGRLVPGSLPHHAGEVPKVDGLRVGDEEGFPVHAFVVQRFDRQGVRVHQCHGGQYVRVRHVAHVREVEQVLVPAELEPRLPLLVRLEHVRNHLHVPLAEDARGPQRDREHVAVLPVRGQDQLLRYAFGLGVGVLLARGAEDGPPLVRVDEVAVPIVHHGRARRVHKRFHAANLPRFLDQDATPFHVDLVIESLSPPFLRRAGTVLHGSWRGRMYYYLGLHFLKDGADGFGGCDVGIVVRGAWEAVVCGAEIEDGDFGGGRFQELRDNVPA